MNTNGASGHGLQDDPGPSDFGAGYGVGSGEGNGGSGGSGGLGGPGAVGGDGSSLPRPGPSLTQLLVNSGPQGMESFLNRLRDITANAIFSQREWLRNALHNRRDISRECDYPRLGEWDARRYHELYRQEAIANRVVTVLPQETWKVSPSVFEIEESDTVTEFEAAWNAVGDSLRGGSYYQDEQGHPIWEILERLDVVSGIGQYGVLLLGLDDANDDGTIRDLSLPVAGVEEVNSLPGERPLKGKRGEDTAGSKTGGKDGGSRTDGGKGRPTSNEGPPAHHQSVIDNPLRPHSSDYLRQRYKLTVNAEKVRERKLLYLRVFPESLAQVSSWETNPSSPRYGQPLMYLISFNDPLDSYTGVGPPISTQSVHWTRVLHVADNIESNEVFAVPRMQPVLRRLLDLQKEYGGSAEGFWQGCIPGLKMESHPQLGANVRIPRSETRDAVEQYLDGTQRILIAEGATINTIAPSIVDPTAQINVQVQAICICLAIPQRIFMGSERGELSSGQDSREWAGRIRRRQTRYVTPRMIVPFVDRLILLGVLPKPSGYSVDWPEIVEATPAEKAQLATQRVQALTAFISGGGEAGMTWMDFWTRIMGYDEQEAEAIITAVAEQARGDEGITTGRSPLLSTVGGANALVALYGAAAQGAMSEDQLRGAFKVLFQLSDNDLDALIADGAPAAAQAEQAALAPPPGEEGGFGGGEDGTEGGGFGGEEPPPDEGPPDEAQEAAPEGTAVEGLTPEEQAQFDALSPEEQAALLGEEAVPEEEEEPAENAFCPTGKGGGVDPSCGTGGHKVTVDDGRTYTVEFGVGGKGFFFEGVKDGEGWHIGFGRQDRRGGNTAMMTHDPSVSPIEVLRQVQQAISRFVETKKPETMLFTAEKWEKSRVKLYDRVAGEMGKTYDYETEIHDYPAIKEYVLRRKKPTENEKRPEPTLSQKPIWNYEANAPLINAAVLTGGRWVTTEDGYRLYVKNGQIAAGNPKVVEQIVNAFCKTGEGGGVDPTCGKGSNRAGPANAPATAKAKRDLGVVEIMDQRRRRVGPDRTHEGVKKEDAGSLDREESREVLRWHDGMTMVGRNGPNSGLPNGTRPELTDLERGALQKYTYKNDKVVNARLRGSESWREKNPYPDSYYDEMKAGMDSAFAKAQILDKPVRVVRGMKLYPQDAEAFAARMLKAHEDGKSVAFEGYTSTARPGGLMHAMGLDSGIPKAFRGNISLQIDAVHGLDMSPHSQLPLEKEFLLDHNSQFKVKKVTQKKDGYHIHLEQIPPSRKQDATTNATEPDDKQSIEDLSPEEVARMKEFYQRNASTTSRWLDRRADHIKVVD